MNHMTDAQQMTMMIMHVVIIAQGLVTMVALGFRIFRGEQTYRSARRTENIVRNGNHA